MKIFDFDSECDVNAPADIEIALGKRHPGGINSFWLCHGPERFPSINISVKGDFAYVHYFPRKGHPGFASVGRSDLRSGAMTDLFISPTEDISVLNSTLVPFSDALKVAQEFAISGVAPTCIRWDSLVAGE
jgi:Immunity protein Imm1